MTFKVFADSRSGGAPLPQYHNPDGGEDITSVLLALLWFSGTATRLVYWLVNLAVLFGVLLIVSTYVCLFGVKGAMPHLEPTAPVILVYSLVCGWILTTTTVRRLRDRGWSNWLIGLSYFNLPILIVIAYFTHPAIIFLSGFIQFWVFIECAFLGSKVD